jgi:hypothetical protein
MSDELHKAVAFEDCDSYELFSPADRWFLARGPTALADASATRQEFIFRILKHLVIGGGMCQVAHAPL